MPNFLCDEMKDYLGMLYGIKKKERIFTITKSYLHHEMDRGAKSAGVKRIRIHDLRHSHISLLIDMGFSAVAIADRVGHESIEITYRYRTVCYTAPAWLRCKIREPGFPGIPEPEFSKRCHGWYPLRFGARLVWLERNGL